MSGYTREDTWANPDLPEGSTTFANVYNIGSVNAATLSTQTGHSYENTTTDQKWIVKCARFKGMAKLVASFSPPSDGYRSYKWRLYWYVLRSGASAPSWSETAGGALCAEPEQIIGFDAGYVDYQKNGSSVVAGLHGKFIDLVCVPLNLILEPGDKLVLYTRLNTLTEVDGVAKISTIVVPII